MTTVHDVKPEKLITAVSKWVKTGRHKEMPPMNNL